MASVLYLDRSEARDVNGYGEGVCIDCGTVGARLLHPGFPHICSRCLFPPAQPEPRELAQALMPSARRWNRVAS